jgi:hypothetical protein
MGSWVINKFSTYQQKEKRSKKEKVNNNNSKFKVNLKSQPISGIHRILSFKSQIPSLKFQILPWINQNRSDEPAPKPKRRNNSKFKIQSSKFKKHIQNGLNTRLLIAQKGVWGKLVSSKFKIQNAELKKRVKQE